jgi:hypothetical protein
MKNMPYLVGHVIIIDFQYALAPSAMTSHDTDPTRCLCGQIVTAAGQHHKNRVQSE